MKNPFKRIYQKLKDTGNLGDAIGMAATALSMFLLAIAFGLSSCNSEANATGIAGIDDFISAFKGELVGNDYYISEYDHYGHKVMTVRGDKVSIHTEKRQLW